MLDSLIGDIYIYTRDCCSHDISLVHINAMKPGSSTCLDLTFFCVSFRGTDIHQPTGALNDDCMATSPEIQVDPGRCPSKTVLGRWEISLFEMVPVYGDLAILLVTFLWDG